MKISEEVNTGRQTEFDYMKGIFMLFIYLIHAYQATGTAMGPAVSCIYVFATMSGAAIFIFVVGFGTVYDKKTSPSRLVKRGIRMVVYQYLTNILYVLALLIPYPFVKKAMTPEGSGAFDALTHIYIQYINIFFITGIIYLVLALLKKVRLPLIGYPALAAVTAIAAPMIYGTGFDIPVIGYVTTLLIGEGPFVSFTPLYYLPYALIGVAAGYVYRGIKDKDAFYRRVIPACSAVILIWWVSVYIRLRQPFYEWGDVSDIASFTDVMDYAYSCPDIWHVVATVAHIMLFAGILYFLVKRFCPDDQSEGRGMISAQILYYNRHITAYYAVHLAVYLVAFGIHGYLPFDSPFVLLLPLISMAVTEVIVRRASKLEISLKLKF